MNKPELLAPAGNLDILKIAFLYGADAVYCGTPKFAMRARVGMTEKDLKEGIEHAHQNGKKVYVTVNAFPHSGDIEPLKKHIEDTMKLKPDALIVADPGIVQFVLENFKTPVHLSTQANTTNHLAAKFWQKIGVERIVLARELSLKDITLIHQKLPDLQIEAFVHGAMCMAYSGRCQISNYFAKRDPNKGACVQACRFKYKLYALEEEYRPGEIFPIYEDEDGTHLLNSKDLSMIKYLPELIKAGVTSLKIEGRLKSEYYVATVVRAYRQAIDQLFENREFYAKNRSKYQDEIEKTASRGFTTGFYRSNPDAGTNNYLSSKAQSSWGYIGRTKKYDAKNKILQFEAKNYLALHAKLEIMTPDQSYPLTLTKMKVNGTETPVAHAGNIVEIPFSQPIPKDSLLRIKL